MNDEETIFIAKIQQALSLLDEIDDIIKNNPTDQSSIDTKLSDYYHLIQHQAKNMSDSSKIKLINDICETRIDRERHNDIYLIGDYYSKHKQSLLYKSSRKNLYEELSNLISTLHKPYNYRVLNESDINDYINDKKIVKKSKDRNKKITKEELEKCLRDGKKTKEIANMYNISEPYVSMLKKEYGLKTRDYKKGDK